MPLPWIEKANQPLSLSGWTTNSNASSTEQEDLNALKDRFGMHSEQLE